ncbi:MAG: hypothetical protein JSU65_01330 [Candidatus Zixiibacteriota bacterium]|nr:MAG: hypothetical protein JSU65_01330 [candidate division Zixibacteria bacterium]
MVERFSESRNRVEIRVIRVFSLILMSALLPPSILSGVAEQFELQSSSDSGITGNAAIVAIEHAGGIYLGTAFGINYSFDGGQSWAIANSETGLKHDDISALYSTGSRLWAGTNRDTIIGATRFSWSEGLYYSDDDGSTWTQIDFGPGGLNIPNIWGGDRTVFDITGHSDVDFFNHLSGVKTTEWMFFAAFAGGLLASQDGGMSWRRIYPSLADSVQYNSGGAPSYSNRVFSCAADSSHGDTLMLWTGTAAGIFQYIFLTPRDKLYLGSFDVIALCDTCTDSTDNIVYFGGAYGLARGQFSGRPYFTRFERDGLPGNRVTALIDVGGRILIGTVDTATFATNLAASSDAGNSFTNVIIAGLGNDSSEIRSDFARIGSRVYMAAGAAGLFVSSDSGLTWSKLPVSVVPPANVDTVYAVETYADTLLVGSEAGLVRLYLDALGNVDSTGFDPFGETDSTSSRIVQIKIQTFVDTAGVPDSSIIWTAHRAATGQGQPMVGRKAVDGTWDIYQIAVETYDIGFAEDTLVVLASDFGTRFIDDFSSGTVTLYRIAQLDPFGVEIDNLRDDTVTFIANFGDTVLVGSSGGYALSVDRGESYRITRPNHDTLRADLVVNHNWLSSLNLDDLTYGLTGDFVPALKVAYQDTGAAYVWASGRPVDKGWPGRSVARFVDPVIVDVVTDTATGDTLSADTVGYTARWQAVDTLDFAWNFALIGDSVLSATNSGLLLDTSTYMTDSSMVIPLINDTLTGDLVDPGTAVYAVQPLDPYLWVGTDDGTVRLSLSNLADGRLFMKVDSTTPADQVYAYPVPFSPQRGGTLDFRFVVQQSDYVTIEVYDFAMNLVARPIDNVFYNADFYPNGVVQGQSWDGRNGRGDVVAVGIYYFKVIFGSGEMRWGKLAVIP